MAKTAMPSVAPAPKLDARGQRLHPRRQVRAAVAEGVVEAEGVACKLLGGGKGPEGSEPAKAARTAMWAAAAAAEVAAAAASGVAAAVIACREAA